MSASATLPLTVFQITHFIIQHASAQYPMYAIPGMQGVASMQQMMPYSTQMQTPPYYPPSNHKNKKRNRRKRNRKKKKNNFRTRKRSRKAIGKKRKKDDTDSMDSESKYVASKPDSESLESKLSENCMCDYSCEQCKAPQMLSCCEYFCSTICISMPINQDILYVPYVYPVVLTNIQSSHQNPPNPPENENKKSCDTKNSNQNTYETTSKTTREGNTVTTGKPSHTTEKPSGTTEKPSSTTGKPSSTPEKPSGTTEKLSKITTEKIKPTQPDSNEPNGNNKPNETSNESEHQVDINNLLLRNNKKSTRDLVIDLTTNTKIKNINKAPYRNINVLDLLLEADENKVQDKDFNEIIFRVPGTSKKKYVVTSLAQMKDSWIPRYGIVPIPNNLASELIKQKLKPNKILSKTTTKSKKNTETKHNNKNITKQIDLPFELVDKIYKSGLRS